EWKDLKRHNRCAFASGMIHQITSDLLAGISDAIASVGIQKDFRRLYSVHGQYDDLSFGGARLSARPSFVYDLADIAGSVEFQVSHNSLFDKRGAELNRLFDMHGCVVLGLNGAKRNTIRVAFASASTVVFLRIASLWKTEDFDFQPVNLEPVKPFLELLVAVSLSDLRHRKISRTIRAKNAVPFLVIARHAQRIFRVAVPGL